jgi:hypothetical protein
MRSAGFFQCPNEITTLAPRVGFAAAWVYVLLLRHADTEGRCWPQYSTLAEESGLSLMTVRRALDTLDKEGFVKRERTGRANMFTVNTLIVLTEQSDSAERTITGEMNNQSVLTEQSECSHRTIREVPPSSPPSLLPPDPHTLNPPIIPPLGEEDPRRRHKKNTCVEPSEFVAFYQAYPRKVARPIACAAWQKLNPDADMVARIMEGLQRSLPGWQQRDVEFIPHPATWLNQHRWEDEGVPAVFSRPPPKNVQTPPLSSDEKDERMKSQIDRVLERNGFG